MARRIGMKNKFTFIGADGSLGYRHGKEYDLDMEISSTQRVVIYPSTEELELGVLKLCVYGSLNAFKNNWLMYSRVYSELDPYGEENWD